MVDSLAKASEPPEIRRAEVSFAESFEFLGAPVAQRCLARPEVATGQRALFLGKNATQGTVQFPKEQVGDFNCPVMGDDGVYFTVSTSLPEHLRTSNGSPERMTRRRRAWFTAA